VNPLTCQAAVHAASDQLAGLLSDAERRALADHLAGCDSCSCLMDQLHRTVAVLGSRPEVLVPDSLRAMVARTEGGRAEALTAQLRHLYALANALDANAADDFVQETLTSALADPDTDTGFYESSQSSEGTRSPSAASPTTGARRTLRVECSSGIGVRRSLPFLRPAHLERSHGVNRPGRCRSVALHRRAGPRRPKAHHRRRGPRSPRGARWCR
jgi:hypothetical protein